MMRNVISILFTLWLLASLLSGCGPQPARVTPPDYWPTQEWRSDSPANHGFNDELPAAVDERVQSDLPFLDAILVIRHGYIVHEHYYNGYDASMIHDIASVTKSWTSALVGMAQAQGKLSNLDAPLSELLPRYFSDDAYKDKQMISLRHLLMMRSGIEFDEDKLNTGVYGGVELLEGDLTAFALSFPMAFAPGEAWTYSTLDTQLVSAIFSEAMGASLASFAASTAFKEMGIGPIDWLADGNGVTIGGQNLSMRPRDMAKLGLLYLHNGVWEGEQLVPAEWVRASLTPQREPAFFLPTNQVETIEWYGYLWWLWKGEWFYGYRSFQASGYAGQQVLVFPELDLIVATTAHMEGVDPAADIEQRTALDKLITEVIFPTLMDVELAPLERP